jgi:hypothetical protein
MPSDLETEALGRRRKSPRVGNGPRRGFSRRP